MLMNVKMRIMRGRKLLLEGTLFGECELEDAFSAELSINSQGSLRCHIDMEDPTHEQLEEALLRALAGYTVSQSTYMLARRACVEEVLAIEGLKRLKRASRVVGDEEAGWRLE